MENISEPTAEQCTANEKVFGDQNTIGYGIWYPQMRGRQVQAYIGKAVAIIDKATDTDDCSDDCFDVLVWHDGEFPFGDGDKEPVRLHHCSAAQFIQFGQEIQAMQAKGGANG